MLRKLYVFDDFLLLHCSYLDGDDVPNKSWIGNFNITYRITSKTPMYEKEDFLSCCFSPAMLAKFTIKFGAEGPNLSLEIRTSESPEILS